MSFHAANPTGFSYLSTCPVESANKSLSTRNRGGELRPSYGGHALSNRAAMAATFRTRDPLRRLPRWEKLRAGPAG